MITTKEEFVKKFSGLAERDADMICPKNREAYLECWFDSEWEKYQEWYKKEYPKAFRESLTLEQLWRLDH